MQHPFAQTVPDIQPLGAIPAVPQARLPTGHTG